MAQSSIHVLDSVCGGIGFGIILGRMKYGGCGLELCQWKYLLNVVRFIEEKKVISFQISYANYIREMCRIDWWISIQPILDFYGVIIKRRPQNIHTYYNVPMPLLSWREYAQLTLNEEDLQIVLQRCSDSNWIIHDSMEYYHLLCKIRNLREKKLVEHIEIGNHTSKLTLSEDTFCGIINLMSRWKSCILENGIRLFYTGLSMKLQRRFGICLEDQFQIGMQWQDVWIHAVPVSFVPWKLNSVGRTILAIFPVKKKISAPVMCTGVLSVFCGSLERIAGCKAA